MKNKRSPPNPLIVWLSVRPDVEVDMVRDFDKEIVERDWEDDRWMSGSIVGDWMPQIGWMLESIVGDWMSESELQIGVRMPGLESVVGGWMSESQIGWMLELESQIGWMSELVNWELPTLTSEKRLVLELKAEVGGPSVLSVWKSESESEMSIAEWAKGDGELTIRICEWGNWKTWSWSWGDLIMMSQSWY